MTSLKKYKFKRFFQKSLKHYLLISFLIPFLYLEKYFLGQHFLPVYILAFVLWGAFRCFMGSQLIPAYASWQKYLPFKSPVLHQSSLNIHDLWPILMATANHSFIGPTPLIQNFCLYAASFLFGHNLILLCLIKDRPTQIACLLILPFSFYFNSAGYMPTLIIFMFISALLQSVPTEEISLVENKAPKTPTIGQQTLYISGLPVVNYQKRNIIHSLLWSSVAAWWFFSLIRIFMIESPATCIYHDFAKPALLISAGSAIFIYLCQYEYGYIMNTWASIRKGIFFDWQHDKIYTAPLLIIICSIAPLLFLNHKDSTFIPLAFSSALFFITLLLLHGGPDRQQWDLTGRHAGWLNRQKVLLSHTKRLRKT